MSMRFDLAIRGGTVATASGLFKADVGIKAGRIVALDERITEATQTIDATGRYVTPGGVDTHCHIDEPPEGDAVAPGSFQTESASALAGGTTTIVPFVVQQSALTMREAVDAYKRKASGSRIDYSFHFLAI